jgi:hypothetical protein
MKLVIHAGMPKAGSTSIQNILFENRDSFLQDYGLFYPTPEGSFHNHFDFYKLVSMADKQRAQEYLQEIVAFAKRYEARTIVLSSEDLFFLPSHDEAFQILLDVVSDDVTVVPSFFLVVRHPNTWIRSHLMQIISNGAFAMDENSNRYVELGQFVAQNTRRFLNSGLPATLIPYTQISSNGGIISAFFDSLGISDVPFRNRLDNVTGKERFFSAEMLVGLVCGLRALNSDNLHVNSPEIDSLRRTLREAIDSAAGDQVFSKVFNSFENVITAEISKVIARSCEMLSTEDIELFEKIRDWEYL